jgi:hypothetical protein
MGFRSLRRHDQVFVRCHDAHGRPRDLAIAYDERGNITLTMTPGETIVLAPLQAGRVRGLVRNALIAASAALGGSRAAS